ncbi:MAG: porin [Phycisphaerae bacterium]|nr:porin [Phycisphaerae bacterium]
MSASKLLVEFIGTFFLVLVIGMTAFDPSLPAGLAPVAIGAVLATMIFAVGHISGAHFNPAVTLALTIRGATPRKDTGPYMLVQIGAAVAAGLIVMWASPPLSEEAAASLPLDLQIVPTMVFETLFTFALVMVILNVATAKALAGNQFFGLAIGLVVMVGAYVAGPVSGGAFNPAVTFALGTMGIADWSDVWMHFCGQISGSLLAVSVFLFTERQSAGD